MRLVKREGCTKARGCSSFVLALFIFNQIRSFFLTLFVFRAPNYMFWPDPFRKLFVRSFVLTLFIFIFFLPESFLEFRRPNLEMRRRRDD